MRWSCETAALRDGPFGKPPWPFESRNVGRADAPAAPTPDCGPPFAPVPPVCTLKPELVLLPPPPQELTPTMSTASATPSRARVVDMASGYAEAGICARADRRRSQVPAQHAEHVRVLVGPEALRRVGPQASPAGPELGRRPREHDPARGRAPGATACIQVVALERDQAGVGGQVREHRVQVEEMIRHVEDEQPVGR